MVGSTHYFAICTFRPPKLARNPQLLYLLAISPSFLFHLCVCKLINNQTLEEKKVLRTRAVLDIVGLVAGLFPHALADKHPTVLIVRMTRLGRTKIFPHEIAAFPNVPILDFHRPSSQPRYLIKPFGVSFSHVVLEYRSKVRHLAFVFKTHR